MNGARTTLEVRLVHCIGSVLDLEAVYTLMRATVIFHSGIYAVFMLRLDLN